MLNFKKRPYNLLLITAILLFGLAIFTFDSTIDFILFGKHYSVPLTILLWLNTIILLIFWLLYMVTKRLLFSPFLTKTHIIFTVSLSLILVAIAFTFIYSSAGSNGPRRYYDYGDVLNKFKVFNNMSPIISIALVLLIFGQLIFFINLLPGIYNKAAFTKQINKNENGSPL